MRIAGGQVTGPSQMVGIATKIVKRRFVEQKEMRPGSYLTACPGKLSYSEGKFEKKEIEQGEFTYHDHLPANDIVSPGKHCECEGAVLLYEH